MAYNTINGLFHIPDEGSFLKKLILANEAVFNGDIETVIEHLKSDNPNVTFIKEEHYFSLILPTQSPGLKLEAMLITTLGDGVKLLSIYHRLHFDPRVYEMENHLIEADAFLHLACVVVNIPVEDNLEGLAYLINYQIQEALNIEVTMLSLCDSDNQVVMDNILLFIMNAVGRYMLACCLDGVEYMLPQTSDDLARMVSDYCDISLVAALTGIGYLEGWRSDLKNLALSFIPEFASSTVCLMFLYMSHDQIDHFLNQGFESVKEYLLHSQKDYDLKSVVGDAQTLNSFQRID